MEKINGDVDVERDRQEDRMIGSPSSDGKMVIKLKFPKLAAAMEVEKSSSEDVIGSFSTSSSKTAKEVETMNQVKRVCPECNKEFSSGKALGGHMRVHVQAANKNAFLKPLKTTKFKKAANRDFNNGDGNLKLIDIKKEQQEQRKPYYMSCVNDDGKPTCSLCGKIFPSMKSLFGHMRCHPERVWRGILPPPNTPTIAARRRKLLGHKPNSFASSPSSSSSENGLSNNEEGSNIVDDHGDQVIDLTKFLRGWSVTERRGRRALKPVNDDEVLLEAVEDLMSLAHGDQSMAESDVTQRLFGVELIERSNSNSLTNKDLKIDEKSPSIDLLAKYVTEKGKAVKEEEIEGKPPAKMESDEESDSRNTEQLLVNYKYKNPLSSPYKSPTKIKKRKKMKLMMELEQLAVSAGDPTPPPPLLLPMTLLPEHPAITESKYKCTTCNKCCASHQALGGHRSSHNKSKITLTDHHHTEADDYESLVMNQSGEKEVEYAADVMVAIGSTGTASNNSNNGVHQCKICYKNFPTGQALGGHKRCHFTGTTEAQAPSSQITSTGEAASQTGSGRRRGLDIDLNEFPPTMMEDEAGNGNGNGYASSSYNSYMG